MPEVVVNTKGKSKRVYRWYATPWEILGQLPGIYGYLKEGVTIQELERKAGVQTDTQAAEEMQKAKEKLFSGFYREKTA